MQVKTGASKLLLFETFSATSYRVALTNQCVLCTIGSKGTNSYGSNESISKNIWQILRVSKSLWNAEQIRTISDNS